MNDQIKGLISDINLYCSMDAEEKKLFLKHKTDLYKNYDGIIDIFDKITEKGVIELIDGVQNKIIAKHSNEYIIKYYGTYFEKIIMYILDALADNNKANKIYSIDLFESEKSKLDSAYGSQTFNESKHSDKLISQKKKIKWKEIKIEKNDTGNMITNNKTINITHTNVNDIHNNNFKKSNILFCSLNGTENLKLKYKSILESIYKIINDKNKIIKASKLNIETIKKNNKGFYYLKTLKISVQGVDSNKCLSEIINQCIENKIILIMEIKLNNGFNINVNL